MAGTWSRGPSRTAPARPSPIVSGMVAATNSLQGFAVTTIPARLEPGPESGTHSPVPMFADGARHGARGNASGRLPRE
jgi:hypothetical protein